MEGMSFDTPKGKMTFRKENHQAMQRMYHFRIKTTRRFAWGVPLNWCSEISRQR